MSWAETKSALNSTVGTENMKPLDVIFKEYFAGEREQVEVELNLLSGNQEVYPSDGKTIEKLTILKPDTLKSENIVSGISIAGVPGSYIGINADDFFDYVVTTGQDGYIGNGESFEYNSYFTNNNIIDISFMDGGMIYYYVTGGAGSTACYVFYNSESFDPSDSSTYMIVTFYVQEAT